MDRIEWENENKTYTTWEFIVPPTSDLWYLQESSDVFNQIFKFSWRRSATSIWVYEEEHSRGILLKKASKVAQNHHRILNLFERFFVYIWLPLRAYLSRLRLFSCDAGEFWKWWRNMTQTKFQLVFTRCHFQNAPVRVSFSKSVIFKVH